MTMPSAQRQRGVALPVVMVALAMLSMVAVALMRSGASEYRAARILQEATRMRHGLDAGLQRGLLALLSSNDPLLSELKTTRPVAFDYNGATITLDLAFESGKVDINAARPELLTQALRGIFGADQGERLAHEALARRERGRRVHSVEALLPLEERQGPLAARLRTYFTVHTGQAGVAPAAAPLAVLEHVPNITPDDLDKLRRLKAGGETSIGLLTGPLAASFAEELPIYTLGATIKGARGLRYRRELSVALTSSGQRYAVLFWGSVTLARDE